MKFNVEATCRVDASDRLSVADAAQGGVVFQTRRKTFFGHRGPWVRLSREEALNLADLVRKHAGPEGEDFWYSIYKRSGFTADELERRKAEDDPKEKRKAELRAAIDAARKELDALEASDG